MIYNANASNVPKVILLVILQKFANKYPLYIFNSFKIKTKEN